MELNTNKQQHLYKILVVGDYAVGKTSIIKRYCEGYFTPNYKLTIGVDFAVKAVEWDEDTTVSLQLWDVAGHERFGTMTRVYYKYAIAAIIVFDLSRPPTFEAVTKWRDDVNSKVVLANDQPIPCLLLANKCDIPGVSIDTAALDQFVETQGFIGWFATSAQNNTNIDKAMKFLVANVLEVAKNNSAVPKLTEDTITLDEERKQQRATTNSQDGQSSSFTCCLSEF
ncbi:Ras-related protein Rab-32B [Balamuthia mandrillaris]